MRFDASESSVSSSIDEIQMSYNDCYYLCYAMHADCGVYHGGDRGLSDHAGISAHAAVWSAEECDDDNGAMVTSKENCGVGNSHTYACHSKTTDTNYCVCECPHVHVHPNWLTIAKDEDFGAMMPYDECQGTCNSAGGNVHNKTSSVLFNNHIIQGTYYVWEDSVVCPEEGFKNGHFKSCSTQATSDFCFDNYTEYNLCACLP